VSVNSAGLLTDDGRYAVAFNPRGQLLAIASDDKTTPVMADYRRTIRPDTPYLISCDVNFACAYPTRSGYLCVLLR
jgi:hypothetical protein